MKIDLNEIRKFSDEGIISTQRNPEFPLLIHNYTQRCQWERVWNPVTLQCRGLITDLAGNVVCRPFPKFFNLSEHTAHESLLSPINWRQDFHVTEKMDGSLGVLYPTPDGPRIATRGSFVSDQAIRGTEMLESFRSLQFRHDLTYLFEIIFPENRIVLNYGERESLVLLDIIDNESGYSLQWETIRDESERLGCELVIKHYVTADELASYSSDNSNREGVVVRFADGIRIKIKLDEYCRLHKLITGVNSKSIWEMLRDGKSIDELLDRVPDEFFDWVSRTAEDLRSEYWEIEEFAKEVFGITKDRLNDVSRKEYAVEFGRYSDYASILFLMLDGCDYSQAIWKKLKPEKTEVFSNVEE